MAPVKRLVKNGSILILVKNGSILIQYFDSQGGRGYKSGECVRFGFRIRVLIDNKLNQYFGL